MTSSLQYQDYKFQYQTSAGIWRWTTRVDLSGSTPSYSVLGIVSPWGLYREDAPIPGAVVQDMAASITTVQQAFPPVILIGPPSSLVFDVDEGRGFSDPQSIDISNSGTWGSLLGVSLVPSSSWISATPAAVGGLPPGSPASVDIAVDATTLQAALGPYMGSVTVTDPAANNNPQAIPVTVNVRSKAVIATDVLELDFTVPASIDGTFPAVPTQQLQLRNDGPVDSLLTYQIQKLTGLSNWLLGFAPPVGDLTGGDSLYVTVQVQPWTNMSRGTYTETLRISGYSENGHVDVLIRLVIT